MALCRKKATVAAAAAYAIVRGEKADSHSDDAAGEIEAPACGRARAFGIDRGKQLLHRAGRRRAQHLVEVDGLVELLTHQVVMTGKFTIARQRLLDAHGVAAAERSGRMPRQESFDLLPLRAPRCY